MFKKYPCVFRTGERVDTEPIYREFIETCADELTPAYSGSDAWKGVRVFDVKGSNRLSELPILKAHLDFIGMEHVVMVNYYNLAPNSSQHAHRDQSGNLLFNISRIHIPLKTNPKAVLEVEHKPYHFPEGELWCLDTSGLHAARNDGDEGRVHLVIDVKRAPATERYFPKMTLAVRIHLARFVAIMAFKLLRDVLSKPETVLDRAGYIVRTIFRSRTPAR